MVKREDARFKNCEVFTRTLKAVVNNPQKSDPPFIHFSSKALIFKVMV
jgi:hypothetical protein